jgi:hypothetical protein
MSHPDDDQYAGLSSTFADVCRRADAEQRRKKPARSNVVTFLPRSTLEAAEYLARLNDLEQMRTWLAKHTAAEREAIFKHLKGEK